MGKQWERASRRRGPGRSPEQLSIDDDRESTQIVALLRGKGYDPVFKEWDRAFLDCRAGAS